MLVDVVDELLSEADVLEDELGLALVVYVIFEVDYLVKHLFLFRVGVENLEITR